VEPTFYHEAGEDPMWRKAVAEQIQALEKNQTWTMEDLPLDKKIINCEWVYMVKYNSNGSIEWYKACLVIRGDQQVAGFNYSETFAPVWKND